jgi:NADH-quinone oxidoreductase subunit M
MYGLPFLGGMTIMGAYYMLKMYQQVMGETNTKTFKDVNFKEGFAFVIIAVLFFWDVSKTITDLITPSLENILTHINRIN